MIFDMHGVLIKKIPKQIGATFLMGTSREDARIFRRGRGIIYSGHRGGIDPTIMRAFFKRHRRRGRKL